MTPHVLRCVPQVRDNATLVLSRVLHTQSFHQNQDSYEESMYTHAMNTHTHMHTRQTHTYTYTGIKTSMNTCMQTNTQARTHTLAHA